MKNTIKRLLPRWVKQKIFFVCYSFIDFTRFISSKSKREMLPPSRRSYFVGSDNFESIGEEFLEYFKTLCNLMPDERVLDIGCGIGRMAIPLTKYINRNGAYEGIDIVKQYVSWCNQNITPKYINFRFQLSDLFNKAYNPKGEIPAHEYVFPFNSEFFDFIFATSVFTHMLPKDVEHYLTEISRVLRPGGRCLSTFFILNESVEIQKETKELDFKYDIGIYKTDNAKEHESAVAYREQYIRSLYKKAGLKVREPIHYGSWSGRTIFLSFQDIVIAYKS